MKHLVFARQLLRYASVIQTSVIQGLALGELTALMGKQAS